LSVYGMIGQGVAYCLLPTANCVLARPGETNG
jgi:hypothetical protein